LVTTVAAERRTQHPLAEAPWRYVDQVAATIGTHGARDDLVKPHFRGDDHVVVVGQVGVNRLEGRQLALRQLPPDSGRLVL